MILSGNITIFNEISDYLLDENPSCNFSVITKYDNAIKVIKHLLMRDNTMPAYIEIADALYDGYDKEFIIGIGNGDVYCEKFFRDTYISPGDDVLFILDDCSDECVKHLLNIYMNDVFAFCTKE